MSEKLFEMMDVRVAVTSGIKTKNQLEGNITFENVTFEYPTKLNVEVFISILSYLWGLFNKIDYLNIICLFLG